MTKLFPSLLVGAVVLALGCVPAGAQQVGAGPPPAVESAEEATGKVSGTILSAQTGEPLRGASVWILSAGRRGPRGRTLASTNLDGKFFFEHLPAGEYALMASKTGYETRSVFREQGKVRVPSGGSAREVVLRLRPSAVIEGRVVDVAGEPLPKVEVVALRRSYRPGTPQLTRGGQATTNDLGEYRIFGLEAGRYLVRAGPQQELAGPGVSYFEYRPVFYPAAPTADGAVEMKLSWGVERTGVDFEVGPALETSLTALVLNAAGKLCRECSVSVWDSQNGPQGIGSDVNRDGLATFYGLPPGAYTLWVENRGPETDFGLGQVQVREGGRETVQLQVTQGQSVSGEVVFEDPPEQTSEQDRPMRPTFIRLEPDFNRRRGVRPEPLREGSGQFEVTKVPPGSYSLRLFGLPGTGYLKAITLSGRPLAEPRITVADAPVSNLKLRVAFDGATIQGVVQAAKDDSLPEGRVTVIPDRDSQGYQLPRSTRFSEDGQFTINGVTPGSYRIYASSRSANIDLWNPAVQRVLEPWVAKVSLDENEQAKVELDLIPELEGGL